jgi:hypothetical protein
MKYPLLLVLACVTLRSSANPITYVSVEEAIRKGWLAVEFTGITTSTDELENEDVWDLEWSSHNGQCISLVATNQSGRPLHILVETGRLLAPDDTLTQTMMVTQQLAFSIPASTRQEHRLYAMCTEMSDSSPGGMDAFTLGLVAESDLLGMASLIEKYEAQNETGQNAVWVITDDLQLSDIQGEDANMVAALRHYASDVTGKTIEPEKPEPLGQQESRYNVPLFSGSIEFGYRVLQASKVSLSIYGPDGNEVKAIMAERPHEPGIYTITYTTHGYLLEPGVYTMKMYQDGQFITFKQFRID